MSKPAPCGIYGDISGDGTIGFEDYRLIKTFVDGVAIPTADQKIRADVDGDGEITYWDVKLIQKFLDGTIDTFPVCGTVQPTRCAWTAAQDTSKVAFISEMVLAYNNLMNIGFTPSANEIGQAVLMYAKLGTPASLWGC